MKKSWIIAAAAVLLVVVLLVVVLILTSGKSWDSGDEDSLYAYSFKEKSDGLQITIEGDVPEGFLWRAESNDISIVSVEETDQDDDEAEFMMRPIRYGGATVNFRLMRDSENAELCMYELQVNLNVDLEQNITVVENGHNEVNQTSVFVPEVNCAMTTGTDGVLTMTFEDRFWNAQELNTAVLDIVHNENQIRFAGADMGKATVYVQGAAAGKQLQVELEVDAKLAVTYVSHTVSDYKDPRDSEDITLFRQFYGDVSLPVDAVLEDLSLSTMESLAGGGKNVVGTIKFHYRDQDLVFQVSSTAGLADLFGADMKSAQPERQVQQGEITANIYSTSSGAVLAWTDSEGRYSYVSGEAAKPADLETVAAALMKVVDHG